MFFFINYILLTVRNNTYFYYFDDLTNIHDYHRAGYTQEKLLVSVSSNYNLPKDTRFDGLPKKPFHYQTI